MRREAASAFASSGQSHRYALRRYVPLADSCSAANWHSFDQLVGAAGQEQRDGDAKRLGRLEVDVQFHLRGLLHRQISGFLALENARGIDAGQAVRIRRVRSIAYQTSCHSKLAPLIDRRQGIAERQQGQPFAPAAEERIAANYNSTCSQSGQAHESVI